MNPHRDAHAALAERADRLADENAALRDELAGRKARAARLRPAGKHTVLVMALAMFCLIGGIVVVGVVKRVGPVAQVPADGRWHVERLAWTEVASPGLDVEAVHDHYAVGAQGKLLYYDDGRWVPQASGTTADLHAIAALRTDVVAVGAHGAVVRFAPETKTWVTEPSGTTSDLRAVAVQPTSPPTFVAVGDGGTLVVRRPDSRQRPAGWERRDAGTYADLRAVYASPRLLALGANGTLLSSRNGDAWTREDTQAPTATLHALLEEGDRTLVAFSTDGVAIRSRGTGANPWVTVPPPDPAPKEGPSAVRFDPPVHRVDKARHSSEGTGALEGMAVLLDDRPWFYADRTGWEALPPAPERIVRFVDDPAEAPRRVLAITTSGRAFQLGPPPPRR